MTAPVVVDIDGTLTTQAFTLGQIGDEPANRHVMNLVRGFQGIGIPIIVSTARSESLRQVTERWLVSYGVFPEEIYMSQPWEDETPNHVVKERHCKEIEAKYGKPILWLDDERANCESVASLGVPCIHV
jgi:hypothetical protein